MTRINAFRSMKETNSLAWGKQVMNKPNYGALIFAAVLIICSVSVGCSSDKPKPVSSDNQIPVTQPQTAMAPVPAPVMQAENKPAPKKIVHRKPATVNYADKSTGVTFEYPRRYAIETGNAAADLLLSSPIPMNFIQPGGVALAAVELPETGFANTDFSSAFFNVSVHKNLTADECTEFAVPQPKVVESKIEEKTVDVSKSNDKPVADQAAAANAAPETKSDTTTPSSPEVAASSAQGPASANIGSVTEGNSPTNASVAAQPEPQGSKLMLGDLELRGTEAVTGEGTRQSDSKYFHVFQNGACYEFVLNVTTEASAEGVTKHVDRDRVFDRLEKILATVKINPVTPEVTAEAPATPAPATPAQ